jgi:hypothetical protein
MCLVRDVMMTCVVNGMMLFFFHATEEERKDTLLVCLNHFC